jgi:hypothetical protein
MNFYSQIKQYAAPIEPEHLIRKQDLDAALNGFYPPSVPQHRQRIAVGGLVAEEPNGRATVQLLDAMGIPAGILVRNVILLPVQNVQNQTDADNTDLIVRARKDNPLNEVTIV